jgi:hypothetical protein
MIRVESGGGVAVTCNAAAADIGNAAGDVKRGCVHVGFGAKMQKKRHNVNVAMQGSQH